MKGGNYECVLERRNNIHYCGNSLQSVLFLGIKLLGGIMFKFWSFAARLLKCIKYFIMKCEVFVHNRRYYKTQLTR